MIIDIFRYMIVIWSGYMKLIDSDI